MPFAIRVLLGLVAGFALGAGIARTDGGWAARIPGLVEPVGTIFINAIRLAVIPLVMSSLVVGTATSGDARRVSRFGLRALAMILVALLAAALWAAVIAVPTLQRV